MYCTEWRHPDIKGYHWPPFWVVQHGAQSQAVETLKAASGQIIAALIYPASGS